jgi:hypothetical protein
MKKHSPAHTGFELEVTGRKGRLSPTNWRRKIDHCRGDPLPPALEVSPATGLIRPKGVEMRLILLSRLIAQDLEALSMVGWPTG